MNFNIGDTIRTLCHEEFFESKVYGKYTGVVYDYHYNDEECIEFVIFFNKDKRSFCLFEYEFYYTKILLTEKKYDFFNAKIKNLTKKPDEL